MKMAEVEIQLIDGSVVTSYVQVKNRNKLVKKLDKKFKSGKEVVMGAVRFDSEDVAFASWKLSEIH